MLTYRNSTTQILDIWVRFSILSKLVQKAHPVAEASSTIYLDSALISYVSKSFWITSVLNFRPPLSVSNMHSHISKDMWLPVVH